ncbi:MAG: cytochrome c oxidase subunit 3 [Acidobacteria bacterium]|nr:cytochrome c oxidase subunit 3 [Acidobacteriota bacterium]
MTEVATIDLDHVSPAPPIRRRELLFATAFASAGVVMAFATLLGAYLAARNGAGEAWLEGSKIPLTQANMQMATMVMAAVTMQWAVYSISRDDRLHTYLALGVTLLLGLAFVNQTTFLVKQSGVVLAEPGGALFYSVVGVQTAMVLAGVIYIALMGFRALAGQFSSRQPDGISAAAVYWYVCVATYAVVWIAVYVMK